MEQHHFRPIGRVVARTRRWVRPTHDSRVEKSRDRLPTELRVFVPSEDEEEDDDSEPEEGSEASHEETWRDFITDTAQEWRDKVSELRQLTRTLEVEAKSHLNKTTLLQSRYSNAYDIYEKAMHQAQAAEQESREGTKEPAGEAAPNPAPDLGAETSSKSYLSKRPSLLSPHGVSMRSVR